MNTKPKFLHDRPILLMVSNESETTSVSLVPKTLELNNTM